MAVSVQTKRAVSTGFGVGPLKPRLGEQRAFASTSTSWFQLAYDAGGAEEITKPYQESVWVHAALKVLADAASSADLVLWQTDDDEADPVAESDPLVRLFARPNPLMSRALLMQAAMIHRKLDGEDFWFLTDAAGAPMKVTAGKIEVPSQIVPVRGALVESVWNETTTGVNGSASTAKRQIGWRYRTYGDARTPTFPMESVVHFRDYDPYDMRRGLGDVEVLSRSLAVQFQAERYQEGLLRNSGDPGGFVMIKGRLQQPEKNRLEQELHSEFGNPENRGAWKVLDEGAEYKPNNVTPKDMEFLALRKYERDSDLAVLGVPPPLVGIFDNSTYNNLREAQKMLWTGGNGVVSFLRSIEDVLDGFFFRNLRDTKAQKYVARFDLGGVEALQEDDTEKVKAAAEIVQLGIGVSLNESLGMLNVEVDPPENGDVRYVNPLLAVAGDNGAAENGAVAGATSDENPGNSEGLVDPAAAPTPTGEGEIAASGLSLNGAQIQAVKDIVVDVATGVLPRDSGKGLLVTLFGLTDAQAEAMLGSAGKGTTTTPNKPEGGAPKDPNSPSTTDSGSSDADLGDESEDESERAFAGPVLAFDQLSELRTANVPTWRREYWRRLDAAVLTPGEKALRKAASKFLRDYFDAQIKRLRAVANGADMRRRLPIFGEQRTSARVDDIATALLLDQIEWQKKMEKAVGSKLAAIYANALKDAVSDIGGFQVNIADPQVVAALSAQEIKLTEGVTSTLSKKVKAALIEVLADTDAGDIGSVQQAVAEVLPELEGSLKGSFTDIDSRALAIARTETGQAANTARFVHMEENGVEEHEWVTSLDDAVRESHAAVEGQVRKIGEQFSNGLKFPNDPAGPANEVIQCRCTSAAVIKVPTPSEG